MADERRSRSGRAAWAAGIAAAIAAGCGTIGEGAPARPPEGGAARAAPPIAAIATPARLRDFAPPPTTASAAAPEPPPPPAPSAIVAAADPGPRSGELRGGLRSPMPGGVVAGYAADTGLDIAGYRRPVYAIASGTLDYSEPGHTLWTGPGDTPNCVRIELDAPIPYKGRRITHVYYAHLAELEHLQREGELPRRRVEAGELLGISGVANRSPHLHVGLLLDGEVSQAWGTFLSDDAIREVLGGYRKGEVLPGEPPRAK